MEYDKIILDLMSRVVTLEEKVTKLENGNVQSRESELPNASKKYRFLSDYLFASSKDRVTLTFREIEDILKFKLPESATVHRAFWANTTSHSIALSWLSVDFLVVEVNLEEKYITFERKKEYGRMNTVTTEENYLHNCKNYEMVELYKNLKETVFESLENIGTGATSYYASWNVEGKRQFAELFIQRRKIRILTLPPISECSTGELVPDTHLWTLNYQTDIYSADDIDEVKEIIFESYRQIRALL